VSATFHGRDIFAPAAAHLSRGVPPAEFGPVQSTWVQRKHASVVCWKNACAGDVQFIDDFGNVITNIPAEKVMELPVHVSLGGEPPHPIRWVRTYSDAAPGELVSLFSSDGFVEFAEVNGNAARRLAAAVGMKVEVRFG
jgi:S-adenosylmethionine hydrolase